MELHKGKSTAVKRHVKTVCPLVSKDGFELGLIYLDIELDKSNKHNLIIDDQDFITISSDTKTKTSSPYTIRGFITVEMIENSNEPTEYETTGTFNWKFEKDNDQSNNNEYSKFSRISIQEGLDETVSQIVEDINCDFGLEGSEKVNLKDFNSKVHNLFRELFSYL